MYFQWHLLKSSKDDKSQLKPHYAPDGDLVSGGLEDQQTPVTSEEPFDGKSLSGQEPAALLSVQLNKDDEDDQLIEKPAGDSMRPQRPHADSHDEHIMGVDHVKVSEEEIRDQFKVMIEKAEIGDMVDKKILADLEAGLVAEAFTVSN
jgi:hypothetical protein